jgi:general nucleoside transport system permease protein
MELLGEILHLLVTPSLWQLTLESGVLLLLPALGGVISERSGVVNIAMEGMMLTGAFTAVVAAKAFGDPWMATGVAMLAGGLMALLHGIVCIHFRANQIISGVAINILAFGLTAFLDNKLTNFQGFNPLPSSLQLPYVQIPLLSQIPFIGPIFFEQNIIVYVGLFLLVAVNFMLFRTRLGLRIRSVGEHPQAADTAGINVYRIRYGSVISSGLFSGLAGAFLSIGITNVFNPNMTEGRGYIALAAMIFGKWTPFGAFVACLIFGLGSAVVADNSNLHVSRDLLSALPYVLTLVVLAGLVGRSVPPAADGQPYVPGSE